VRDLIYGWGNEDWSAREEYLMACVRDALASRGPILECGSGLTTIVVGIIAQRDGKTLWSLEHAPAWAEPVRKYLRRYRLDRVHLCADALKDYAEFSWYDAPLDVMPGSFGLVICDGPPGETRGGRYGLVPIMKARLRPGCIVLLDDAGRIEERAIAKRWEVELPASCETLGTAKPFARMIVGTHAAHAATDARPRP
jgi:hypothetical protein